MNSRDTPAVSTIRDLIFISFRSNDGGYAAAHLDDLCRREFGDHRVFRSSRSIEPGTTFDTTLRDALARACVVVAVIGPRWYGRADDGTRRIDDPEDWVHIEIATSLRAGIPVIPVLLQDAPRPAAHDLPAPLAELAKRQSVHFRSRHVDPDLPYLLRKLHRILGSPGSRSPQAAGTLALEKLDDLLAARKWQAADRESSRLVTQAAGADPLGIMPLAVRRHRIDDISAADLAAIEALWAEHSGGRFGFAAQAAALTESDGDLIAFGDAVGWRTHRWIFYGEARFDLSAPAGHLPILGPSGGVLPDDKMRWFHDILPSTRLVPGHLRRTKRDRGSVTRLHATPIAGELPWETYLQLHYTAAWDLMAAAFDGRARPFARMIGDGYKRSLFSSHGNLLSVLWAVHRGRLLDRLTTPPPTPAPGARLDRIAAAGPEAAPGRETTNPA